MFLQAYCTDANLILRIKNLIMLFSTTLTVSLLCEKYFYILVYQHRFKILFYTKCVQNHCSGCFVLKKIAHVMSLGVGTSFHK